MPLILCIETSGKRCSVALSRDGATVWSTKADDDAFAHAERLHGMVDGAHRFAAQQGKAIQAVAVSAGPGSYTGLRIGVSAAKGLCMGWSVPLIAISTLQLIAAEARITQPHAHYISMVDARRMDAFVQVFDAQGEAIGPVQFITLAAESELSLFQDALWTGEAAERVLQVNAQARTLSLRADAAHMCALAEAAFAQNKFVDVAYFEPDYYKEFVPGIAKSREV